MALAIPALLRIESFSSPSKPNKLIKTGLTESLFCPSEANGVWTHTLQSTNVIIEERRDNLRGTDCTAFETAGHVHKKKMATTNSSE